MCIGDEMIPWTMIILVVLSVGVALIVVTIIVILILLFICLIILKKGICNILCDSTIIIITTTILCFIHVTAFDDLKADYECVYTVHQKIIIL